MALPRRDPQAINCWLLLSAIISLYHNIDVVRDLVNAIVASVSAALQHGLGPIWTRFQLLCEPLLAWARGSLEWFNEYFYEVLRPAGRGE